MSPGQPFALVLRLGPALPPASQLGLTVTVYDCLSSISAFDQSLSTTPDGARVSTTAAPIPLDQLGVAKGTAVLSMPVEPDNGSVTAPQPGAPFTIDLASSAGQCGGYPSGVYPVRVQLVDTGSGQMLGALTTDLVYSAAGPGTERVRLSLVLPLAAPVPASHGTTPPDLVARPAAALAEPSPPTLDGLAAEVKALADHPTVPLTVEADPQTVAALALGDHQATVSQLAALAAVPAVHQLATPTYVPVDATELVGSGLSSELFAQIVHGNQALGAELGRPAAVSGPFGPWFTAGGMTQTTLSELQALGYSQLVLPAGDVAGSPTNGSAAEPFSLTTEHGAPVTAIASDPDLTARLTANPADPVLEAHQFAAELAQIYFEKPNDPSPRAVAVVAPSGLNDPSLVSALLGSLADNPLVQPVTADGLFATLPDVAACRESCRFTGTQGNGGGGLPVSAIRAERQRITQLAGAAPAAKEVVTQLGQGVLAGESNLLKRQQRDAVLANVGRAVNAQLDQLTVSERSITLTSQRGRIPVTIQSNASYPVTAALTLTSDKLLFADGTTQWTTTATLLPSHTNVIYADVTTRASGLFKVGVTLRSPTGGLVLSTGELSVRSTASSVVGLVLSIGALCVLVAWWVRTSRRRRSRRRATDAGDAPDDDARRLEAVDRS